MILGRVPSESQPLHPPCFGLGRIGSSPVDGVNRTPFGVHRGFLVNVDAPLGIDPFPGPFVNTADDLLIHGNGGNFLTR
jgi:hypothetical protein